MVGIGHTAPKTNLDVSGAVSAGADGSYIGFNAYYSAGWKYKANGYASFLRQDTTGMQIYSAPNIASGADAAMTPVLAMTRPSSGNVGIGATTPTAQLHIAGGKSAGAWTTLGIALREQAATYTDTSSTGTVATTVINSIAQPTLAASSVTTYTDAATFYIANAPAAGANVTITNPYAIYVAAGNSYFAGNVGIGTAPPAQYSFAVEKNITGNAFSGGIDSAGVLQSDVTSRADYFLSVLGTQATAFTAARIVGYKAQQGTIGAGSTVTNLIGFEADANLTGGTNNFGFYSNIALGASRWNFYANGTADNYFAGDIGVGDTTPDHKLDVAGNIGLDASSYINFGDTDGTTGYGIRDRHHRRGRAGRCQRGPENPALRHGGHGRGHRFRPRHREQQYVVQRQRRLQMV